MLTFKYEDLVASPKETLYMSLLFLWTAFDANMLNFDTKKLKEVQMRGIVNIHRVLKPIGVAYNKEIKRWLAELYKVRALLGIDTLCEYIYNNCF